VAVVSCPKCPTTLRIPDGVSGNVKCPKCNALFPVTASGAPAPAKGTPLPPLPPPPKPAAPTTGAKPTSAKSAAGNFGFEVLDEPKPKKKVVADEDDDLDEPGDKKKKKRNDDDDKSTSKKKKSRRRDDDDDDDDWHLASKKKVGHGAGRVGLMMLTISSWLYFSLYALLTLYVFLLLTGVATFGDSVAARPRNTSTFSNKNSSFAEDFADMIILAIGLVGLANWIISIVGFGFCTVGPERARAISIISAIVACVHLLLVIVTYAMSTNSLAGLDKFGGPSNASMLFFATTMPFLDFFLPSLIYGGQSITGEFVVVMLTGICEVVRIFFTLLTIRTLADEGKNHRVAQRVQMGIVITALVLGIGIFVMLLVVVLVVEVKFRSMKTMMTMVLGSFFLQCLAYSVSLAFPAITAMGARSSLARSSR
jgi:hypothetical protein